jgi:hypothetical protein
MHAPSLLAVAVLILPVVLSSCSGSRFYAQVDGKGRITGQPCVEWKKPDKFVYVRGKNPTFAFKRPNGDTIRPGSLETDGGSIPRLLWSQKNFSPWTYAPAYLVHDWLYEAHRRKVPGSHPRTLCFGTKRRLPSSESVNHVPSRSVRGRLAA